MNKTDEEILILDYFRETYGDFPKGRIVKSESPDFILKVSPRKSIGIELTRLDENPVTLKERVENTIEKKDRKIRRYQKLKFDAIWLIIHTDTIAESKSYNLQNKMLIWKFSSEFNKVFLFDHFEKNIFEIS